MDQVTNPFTGQSMVVNDWTDAARRASALARKAGGSVRKSADLLKTGASFGFREPKMSKRLTSRAIAKKSYKIGGAVGRQARHMKDNSVGYAALGILTIRAALKEKRRRDARKKKGVKS